MKKKYYWITGIIIIITLICGCTSTIQPVACTAEAKICPDGSTVGRVPPDCDFAPCPGQEAMMIPEEFSIYQNYIEVIGGVSPFSPSVDTGTVEATVISITESETCPGPNQEGENCTIEPYPNDWGMVRIDKIIDYTPYSEKTAQQPIEQPSGGEPLGQGTTSPYQGQDLPEPKQLEYEPLQEGQEVLTHFLLTTRPVKVRYVPMSISESGTESTQAPMESGSEQTVSQPLEPREKIYKPIPKEPYLDDYGNELYSYVFTTKIADFKIEKVLPGLKVGDRFRAKIGYDGTLHVEEYITQQNITCRGTVCDGFCFTDHMICNNEKITYTDYYDKYFIHDKGETIYSDIDVPFNVYVDYPRSVYPNEIINLNITIESTSSANDVTINNVNLKEWKTNSASFWYCDFTIEGTGYSFENNTQTVLSVPPYINKTVSYILKAPPYPTPYGARIFVTLNSFYHIITNPVTVYNITRKTKCENKIFDPKVGSCSNEILYPSRCERGCNSDQMCPLGYRCIDHECIQKYLYGSQFQLNTTYEIPIVILYLLRNKTLVDQLRISERPYMDSIALNATNWWDNERTYWGNKTLSPDYVPTGLHGTITPYKYTILSNFSIKHGVIDCNISLDEYLSIAQKNPNDDYKTYNEIISRCNINRSAYKIINFFHVLDPDVVYPIYLSTSFGNIILAGGFIYYNSTDPRGKYYSRGNASDQAEVLVHETIHSFGAPDEYVNPGRMYYQYDCYLNTNNNNFTKHLCPMEAFLTGIIIPSN